MTKVFAAERILGVRILYKRFIIQDIKNMFAIVWKALLLFVLMEGPNGGSWAKDLKPKKIIGCADCFMVKGKNPIYLDSSKTHATMNA